MIEATTNAIFSMIGIMFSYLFIGWLVLRLIYIVDNSDNSWDDEFGFKMLVMLFWPIFLIIVICVWFYQPFKNEGRIEELTKVIIRLENKSRKRGVVIKK